MTEPKADKPRTEFLTAQQLAEALQVSEVTIHRLRRAGRIPYVRVTDRIIRYHLREVKQALSSLKPKAGSDLRPLEAAAEPLEAETQLTFDDLLAAIN